MTKKKVSVIGKVFLSQCYAYAPCRKVAITKDSDYRRSHSSSSLSFTKFLEGIEDKIVEITVKEIKPWVRLKSKHPRRKNMFWRKRKEREARQ